MCIDINTYKLTYVHFSYCNCIGFGNPKYHRFIFLNMFQQYLCLFATHIFCVVNSLRYFGLNLPNSLHQQYLHIYIYIYVEREKERERERCVATSIDDFVYISIYYIIVCRYAMCQSSHMYSVSPQA